MFPFITDFIYMTFGKYNLYTLLCMMAKIMLRY